MQKISVGKTIARAYGFLFGRIFQILGLGWLPAAIYAGLSFLWLRNLDVVMPTAHLAMPALAQTVGLYLAVIVAALLVNATIAIALTQQALGVRKDIALAHFVVGPRELRLFLAHVRLYAVFILGYVALVALTVFGVMQAARFGATAGHATLSFGGISILPAGFVLVSIVLWVAFLLSILRLAFLLAPIAAVEHHATLRQSWRLTRGSSWRIVAVLLGVFLPVLLLAATCLWFWLGAGLAAAMQDMMATQPPNAKILIQFEMAHAFDFAVAGGVFVIVMAALQAGATAAAYRAVTGHEEDDSEDDAALVAPLTAPAMSHHDDGRAHETDDHGSEHGGGHEDHGHRHDDDHGQDHGTHDSQGAEEHHGHHAEVNADEQSMGHDDHAHDEGGHDAHAHDGHRQHDEGGHHHAAERDGHESHDGQGAYADEAGLGDHAEPVSETADHGEHHQYGRDEHAAAA